MRFGRAIAVDPKSVDDCLFSALRDSFTEEEIVVITTMGVLIMANNAFNDILRVEPEPMDE